MLKIHIFVQIKIMKSIKVLLPSIITVLLIFSCSKEKFLKGEFKHVESYTIDKYGKKQPYLPPGFINCAFGDSLVSFNKGTLTYYYWDYSWTYPYEFMGDEIQIFHQNGSYTVSVESLEKNRLKVKNISTETYSIYEK